MFDALALARYLVNHFAEKGEAITPLKLQKILYYLKVWGAVGGYEIAAGIPFKAWKYGPVNLDVYHRYKDFGSKPIPPHGNSPSLHEGDLQFVHFIADHYGQFSAVELSARTHKELPWKVTPQNEYISNEAIVQYYSNQPFAQNFPLNPAKSFVPAESDLDHAFSMDMSDEEAESLNTYSSFDEYVEHVGSARQEYDRMFDWFLEHGV